MVRWADSVTGLNLNTFFDAEGNRVRAFTDTGYDPLGQNTGANPNYRYIDHVWGAKIPSISARGREELVPLWRGCRGDGY